MTRAEFENLVFEGYGIKADYPFKNDYETGVMRHESSKKWFAIAMKISASRLGLESNEIIDVVNFKCATEIIESLAGCERGIYRAYHMNKMHWITAHIALCDDDMVAWLLQNSYDLTSKK